MIFMGKSFSSATDENFLLLYQKNSDTSGFGKIGRFLGRIGQKNCFLKSGSQEVRTVYAVPLRPVLIVANILYAICSIVHF